MTTLLPWPALRGAMLCLALFAGLSTGLGAARAAPLRPALHDDFDHYTFALSWQPGWCGTSEGCAADQPKNVLIGIHGLWASLPRSLSDRGIPRVQWWMHGCDFFQHSDADPVLPVAVRRDLDAVLPHGKGSLLHHEYDKHVQCFGFDATTYFQTELAMREKIVNSAFGHDLMQRAGTTVDHTVLFKSFADTFRTTAPRALQLQCHADAQGRILLTQFWITIRHDAIDRFPAPTSLTDAPVVQDNCPASFLIPGW